MAMIVTSLSGIPVTPVDTAKVAVEKHLYVLNQGSTWTIGPVLAEYYGLKSEHIATDIADISAALRAGKMIITAGAGAVPFTEGGHFIAIRGITPDGEWLVGDPAHSDSNTREWSPESLFTQMSQRKGSAYAISK